MVSDCVLSFASHQGTIRTLDNRQQAHACCNDSTSHYFPCSADSLFFVACTFVRSLLLLRYKHYNACLLCRLAFHTQRTGPSFCISLSSVSGISSILSCALVRISFCTLSVFLSTQRKDTAQKKYKRPEKDILCRNGVRDTIVFFSCCLLLTLA